MFMSRGWRVEHLKIIRPSALRRWAVSLNPLLTTDTIISSFVCPGDEKCFARVGPLFFNGSEMLAESVAEPTCSFEDVTQGAWTTMM